MSYSSGRVGVRGFGLGQGDVPAVGQELGIDPRSRASSNGGRLVPTMWLQRALNASGVPSPLLTVDNNAGSSDSSHTMTAARTWAARNGNRTPLPQRTDDPGHVVISTSMEANLSLLRRVADPTGSSQTGWLTPTERGTTTTTTTTTTTPTPTVPTTTAPPPTEVAAPSGMPIWPFAVGAVAIVGIGAWFLLAGPAKKVSSNRRRRVRANRRRSRRSMSRNTGKRFKRPPRVGTRVVFDPTPASHALYSHAPSVGEAGTVSRVALPGGSSHFMRGPGGGLVYVDWDDSAFQGVSLHDLASGSVRRNGEREDMAYLVDEIGSTRDVLRLNEIWSSTRNVGTEYDRKMDPQKYGHIPSFKRAAARAGYSARAINAYLDVRGATERIYHRVRRNGRQRITAKEARAELEKLGIDFRDDFHALHSDDVTRILGMARASGYRKPKNASGSTARMFFYRLARLHRNMRRNPRRRPFSPVPGLNHWNMYAGGTSAREGAHSYDYKQPDWVTEFHIAPPAAHRHGYLLQAYALPGHPHSWSNHGPFKTPHMAAAYARRLAGRTGVQERA